MKDIELDGLEELATNNAKQGERPRLQEQFPDLYEHIETNGKQPDPIYSHRMHKFFRVENANAVEYRKIHERRGVRYTIADQVIGEKEGLVVYVGWGSDWMLIYYLGRFSIIV